MPKQKVGTQTTIFPQTATLPSFYRPPHQRHPFECHKEQSSTRQLQDVSKAVGAANRPVAQVLQGRGGQSGVAVESAHPQQAGLASCCLRLQGTPLTSSQLCVLSYESLLITKRYCSPRSTTPYPSHFTLLHRISSHYSFTWSCRQASCCMSRET